MSSFNPLTQPLKGQHSVEASAGTGKTYSITLLWLRLILEHKLEVDQILVSTFTKAATAELRERLLSSLQNAFAATSALQQGKEPPSSKELNVIRSNPSLSDNGYKDVLSRLSTALGAFDLAPITTIHSFCQSLITKHALELGCDSSLSLVESCDHIIQAITGDFIMRRADDPAIDPSTLESVAQIVSKYPSAALLTSQIPALPTSESLIENIVQAAPSAQKQLKAPSLKAFQSSLEKLQTYGEWKPLSDAQSRSLGTDFQQLWTSYKQAKDAEAHAPVRDLAIGFQSEFTKRKTAARIQGFEDIMHTVQSALKRDGAESKVAKAVRNKIRAAIIDECQDSDGMQIEIFSNLFHHPEVLSFIVIGDPKQSIYRFRGADLASYKKLADSTNRARPMTVNHRSDPDLVEAINRLYGEDYCFEDSFAREIGTSDTGYIQVKAQAEISRIEDPRSLKSLVIQWSDEADRTRAMAEIATQVADECKRLLSETVFITDKITGEKRRIEPSDIAILSNFHRDLGIVRRALNRTGIACQSSGNALGSVYESDEARDILGWLELFSAMETHGDLLEKLVAFLATPLGGYSLSEIHTLKKDPEKQASVCSDFQMLLNDFSRLGPLPLLLRRLSEQRLITANLKFMDGERRFSNWRQIGSLLQCQHGLGRKTASSLRLWLARQMVAPAHSLSDQQDSAESTLMKLDTDAPAVQLSTIHSAKGLEYPVVFCPFLWNLKSAAIRKGKPAALFRYSEGWGLDLGSVHFDDHMTRSLQQEDEEECRKLYVALTRARHRLYLGVAPVSSGSGNQHKNEAKDSALMQLPGLGLTDFDPADWLDRLKLLPEADVLRGTEYGEPGQAINPSEEAIIDQSDLAEPNLPQAYPFPLLRTVSFTALSRSDHDHFGSADHGERDWLGRDETKRADDPLHPLGEGGAALGDQLHLLLESYLGNHKELPEIVLQIQKPEQWIQAVSKILDTKFQFGGLTETCLRSQRSFCITEMQFHFPLSRLSPKILSETFRADTSISFEPSRLAWAESLKDWSFSEFTGFLQGYIDLIFEHEGKWFIADYKSNRLSGYSPSCLEQAMIDHNYLLQARLYALALHRHLGANLIDYDYENHFGGVLYLFVRGFPSEGVWFERTKMESLVLLDQIFKPLPR